MTVKIESAEKAFPFNSVNEAIGAKQKHLEGLKGSTFESVYELIEALWKAGVICNRLSLEALLHLVSGTTEKSKIDGTLNLDLDPERKVDSSARHLMTLGIMLTGQPATDWQADIIRAQSVGFFGK